MLCWTDYPFETLGDESGKKAPVRPALIISYDRNKGCVCIVENRVVDVKVGYLYKVAGRCGKVPGFGYGKLAEMVPNSAGPLCPTCFPKHNDVTPDEISAAVERAKRWQENGENTFCF